MATDQFEALLASADAGDAVATSWTDRLARAIGQALAWVFVAAILLSAYEVVMRYVFGAPSNWVLATTTTLCQIGFAMGGAYCMARREHIRITFVPEKLGPRGRWMVELLALLVGVFYLAGLLYATYLDARTSIWKFGFDGSWAPELTTGPPNWPLPSIGKAALVLGTALFFIVVVNHLGRHLRERSA